MVNIIDRQEYEDISEVNFIAGLKHFNSLADTLDHSLRHPYLIKSWDELTANILENF